MKSILTITLFFISFSVNSQEIYIDNKFNLKFSYPKADAVDRHDKSNIFSKAVFKYGKNSNGSSVQLIFESKSNTIEKFLIKSRENRINGGYEKEIIEKKYKLKNGRKAVQITRNIKEQETIIHYFVFSPINNNILSIFFVESIDKFGKRNKHQNRAKEAYKSILSSLTI